MNTFHTSLSFNTKYENDIVRIDHKIQDILFNDNIIENGIVTAFVPGSTGALSTIEFEPGLIEDFPKILDKMVPKIDYKHNTLNFDDNGHSHIKSTLIGPSLTIPFIRKKLLLGTWQQVVFIEFDTRPRQRKIEIMILGK